MMFRQIRNLFAIWLSLTTLSLASTPQENPRRTQLIQEIVSLNQLGCTVETHRETPTQSEYLVHILHPKALFRALSGSWGYVTPSAVAPDEVLEHFRGARVVVDIDWDRYLAHQPESLQVAWLGKDTQRRSPAVSRFLAAKGVSLLLTFDPSDHLERVHLKPINARFKEGNETTHVHAHGWALTLRRFNPANRYDTAFHLTGDALMIEHRDASSPTQRIDVKGLACDADARHSYDGKLQCVLPTLAFAEGEDRIALDRIYLSHEAKVIGKRVNSFVKIGADTLQMKQRSPGGQQAVRLDAPRFDAWVKDLNVTVLQKLEKLSLHPLPDPNVTEQQGLELVQRLVDGGSTSGYGVTIDRLAGNTVDPSNRMVYRARGVSSRVTAALGSTLAYHEQTSVRSMQMEMHTPGLLPLIVDINGTRYDLAIDHVYNLFSALTALPKRLEVETNSSKDERWYFEEVLGEVIHTGAQATITPIHIGGVTLTSGTKRETYSATELRLNARLKPNTIDVRRSTAPMMMLGSLDLTGHWEMKKRDFRLLLTHVSTQIRIMAMIFVRYEGDKAILDLRLDHGHLRINGKPIL